LGNPAASSGSTLSKQKFSRSVACITKSVASDLGDGCRDANLLLSIKVQGSRKGTCPITAEHDILLSPDGHQQQSRASLGCLRVHM
jgi:hypothetical protein